MNDNIKKNLGVVIITTLVFFLLLGFLDFLFRYAPDEEIISLEDGWTVECDGRSLGTDVSISEIEDLFDDKLPRRSKVTIYRDLPSEVEFYSSPTIYERLNYLSLEFYLGGKLTYSTDMKKMRLGKFVGCSDCYIDLAEPKAGEEIRFEFYTTEEGLVPDITTPKFGDFLDLQYAFLHKYLYPLLGGLFLCIFGVFFLVVSIILSAALPELMGQLISSIISLLFGIWILSSFLLSQVFFHTGHTGDVEYICFYMFLPLMYLLLMDIHEIVHKKIYTLIAVGTSLIIIVLYVLHFLDIAHMSETRPIYFLLALVFIAVLAICDVKGIRSGKLDFYNIIQMAGPTLFCLIGFTAMVYYMVMRSSMQTTASDTMLNMFTTGCILFSLSRFLIYFMLVSETDPRRLEFNSLTRAAYRDTLTGANNRNYYDEALKHLQSSDKKFAVLSMDLNGLKEVNDKFGHGTGDSLLRMFGNILVRETPRGANCFRTGGDEFVVLYENGPRGALEDMVKRVKESLEELDRREPSVTHSAAYGIAYSEEVEGANVDVRNVFILADQRMYDDKQSGVSKT